MKNIALLVILTITLINPSNAQNVGISTAAPVNRLQIGTTPGFSGNDFAIGNGSQGMSFTQYSNSSTWYSNVNFALMPNGSGGNVGIGTQTPVNHLQIGTTPGFSDNDLAIGNGAQGMSFTQYTGSSTWYSNVNFALMPNGSAGNVGIGTQSPVNRLEIGNIGSSGYGGNHIAFGNGSQASGFAQTATAAQWYSTTDIILMPRGNGHGRVGINTSSPSYPLDVRDYVDAPGSGYSWWTAGQGIQSIPYPPHISIYAQNDVIAQGFEAVSDARIKDISGVSNAAQDLEILRKIQVTNYTLKDKITNGNHPYKKVIAQQVESVYPQIISRHTDFIPNVYMAAKKITQTDNGWLLQFDRPHHISKQAKRLKILAEGDNTMKSNNILSVPSDNEVLIDATQLNADKLFVYGEQVDDFRTVDYEGLTTLNISATQELGKIVKRQQAAIRAQNKKIAALTQQLETVLKTHQKLN
jgi:hypothetical protein